MKPPKRIVTFLQRYACAHKLHEEWTPGAYGGPRWPDFVMAPMQKSLAPYFPGRRVEVTGPFGLCCGVNFSVYDDRKKPDLRESWPPGYCLSVVLEADVHSVAWGIRDTTKDTGEFKPMSIGALNGMNHPLRWVRKDLTVSGLARMLRRSDVTRKARK